MRGGAVALALIAGAWAAEGDSLWGAGYKVGGIVSSSSAAVSRDGLTIYVGVERTLVGSNGLLAVTAAGGDKWKTDPLPREVESSPTLSPDEQTVYVGCGDGKLYAFDTANGRKRWAAPETGSFLGISSSPAIGRDGTIYIGAYDGAVHALDPATGSEKWQFATGGIIDLSSAAVAADGTIYIGSRDKNVYAITPEGGKKWATPYPTGGVIRSSPAIGADGTVYVGSADQQLHAIRPDGTRKWAFFTNGDIQASPVIGPDGTIYFASADKNFYALNPDGPDENRVKWIAEVGVTAASTAAVRADGVIIFGADDGKVRALNPDKSLRWTFDTKTRPDDFIEASPTVAPDGSIYIGSSNGSLYKLQGNGSPLSTFSAWPAFRHDISHTGRAVVEEPGELLNLSTRAQSGAGTNLIAGFFIHGTGFRPYLIRGIGPSLAPFGVASFLPDPLLRVFDVNGRQISANDNWEDEPTDFLPRTYGVAEAGAAAGAFPLLSGTKDAALVRVLGPGLYTAHVESADGRSGVTLIEMYDLPESLVPDKTSHLLNLSTRGQVRGGENDLIAGVVVGGTGRTRLLLRGVGPALRQFGVNGTLAQPRLVVFSGNQELRVNTGWGTGGFKADVAAAAQAVGAFALAEGSADSAILITVDPGKYTMQVSGVGGTTGEALVEVYVVP